MKQKKQEPAPPRQPAFNDGHSQASQAFEREQFKYEQDMADIYDPVPDSEPGDMYFGI